MPRCDILVGVINEIHQRMPRNHKQMSKLWGFRIIIDAQVKAISNKNQRRLTAAVLTCVPNNTYEGISLSLHTHRGTHYLVIHATVK